MAAITPLEGYVVEEVYMPNSLGTVSRQQIKERLEEGIPEMLRKGLTLEEAHMLVEVTVQILCGESVPVRRVEEAESFPA